MGGHPAPVLPFRLANAKKTNDGYDGILWQTFPERVMHLPARLLLGFLCIFHDRTVADDPSFVRLVEDAVSVLFPPVRLSAYLCGLDRGQVIALSRIMSRKGLAHEIDTGSDAFEERKHDAFEHRVLYVVDLDCEFAAALLRTANASDMFTAPIRWLLLRDRTLATGNSTAWRTVEETFREMAVYPDSEVILAEKVDARGFTEIISIYRPSPSGDVLTESRGNWSVHDGIRMANFDAASRRRRDLRRAPLKSCLVREAKLRNLENAVLDCVATVRWTVLLRYAYRKARIIAINQLLPQMTDPDTINHLTDHEYKDVDPYTKASYPWLVHIVNRMNATVTFRTTDTWGYRDENGSWSGMIGMLQRREIDLGGTTTFIIPQRIGVVEYVQLYTRTRSSFIFRQPLLSTVSNIFTLPFERSVWMAIGVFLILVVVLLYFSAKWEYRRGTTSTADAYWQQFNPAELTVSDNFMVVLGAVAQQGYSYEPYRVPSRIVTLMLLIAVLSLYASYTANIVALLQSTTDSIKTPADLLYSPLKLGVQDVVYSRYYFKSFQDPIRQAIVSQKIEPKGQNDSWMNIQEGVRRVRNELFAFHAELGAAYKIMQETYQEEEKCGITEIDMLNMIYPLMIIQARSPYSEIVRNAALTLHETGLKFREEKRLYTEKPKCQGQTSFISIGFTECYFALVAMGYGTLLSLAVLAAEIFWYKKYEEPYGGDGDIDSVTFPSIVPPSYGRSADGNAASTWKADREKRGGDELRFDGP